MKALSEVDFSRCQSILNMIDANEGDLERLAANMSEEDAEAIFNAFDQMVTGADKLDGDVIFKGRKLSRVNYGGDFMRLFDRDRAYVAKEGESKKARTVFKTALLKYVDTKVNPGRRDELKALVGKIFSEGQARKPLSRRTISQAVNIVKDARAGNAGGAGPAKNAMIGRALGGMWKKGVEWKLIGGSLGVKMTREHLQTMLSNAMAVAKKRVDGLSKAGASALADGLKAQMNRYLKLFDAGRLGGALERLVINGLDKASVADEMLRQLEKDGIPELLGPDGRRDGTQSLNADHGIVSPDMQAKLLALKQTENQLGSKAILDRIKVCPDTDHAVSEMHALLRAEPFRFVGEDFKAYGTAVRELNDEWKAQHPDAVPEKDHDVMKILAAKPELIKEIVAGGEALSETGGDLIGRFGAVVERMKAKCPNRTEAYGRLETDEGKAAFFGGVRGQFVQQRRRNLLGDLLLNANMTDAVYYRADGERLLVRLTEDADLFNSMCKAVRNEDDRNGGRELLESLGQVSGKLKTAFTDLLEKVNARIYADGGKKSRRTGMSTLEFKSLLFSRLDAIYADIRTLNTENAISEALKDKAQDVAKDVVGQITSVCTEKVVPLDLKIIAGLIVKSSPTDLRRMFATSFREGSGALDGGLDLSGFIRGMGAYGNKVLQGLPLKAETDIEKLNDPRMTAMFAAVSRARNDLPKIDRSILEAEVFSSLIRAGEGDVESVTIDSWLGAGSVAQTGFCKIIRKQSDDPQAPRQEAPAGDRPNATSIVLKTLRPDVEAQFMRDAEIVANLGASEDSDIPVALRLQDGERKALLGIHHTRVTTFREECVTGKELVNALRGLRLFGTPAANRGPEDPNWHRTMKWTVNGKTIAFDEKNLIGSEGLVLKPGLKDDPARTAELGRRLAEAKSDDDFQRILAEFFVTGSESGNGSFLLIECAAGKDLAKFNASFKEEVMDNDFGLGDLKDKNLPADRKIDVVKERRDTIQTLNRALTQLKDVFVSSTLFSKDHFFHCDLTAGNIVFDPETGALTVIDYGKTDRLSDDEALAMVKLQNVELHKADGLKNGEKMREAYEELLDAEIGRLTAKAAAYPAGDTSIDKELDARRLNELTAARTNVSDLKTNSPGLLDEKFQEAFERILNAGLKARPPKVKTVFELFSDVLKDIAGQVSDLSLPLPSAVCNFIDTYSRLQNAINDAQDNLNKLNGKISDLIVEYHDSENKSSVEDLANLKVERFGWFDVKEAKESPDKVEFVLRDGKFAGNANGMDFGPNSFSARVAELNVRLADTTLSLEERRNTLNSLKVLITGEKTRLEQYRLAFGPENEKDQAVLGLKAELGGALKPAGNGKPVAVTFDPSPENDELAAAIKKLDDAEKAVVAEADLVSKTVVNDSMFSTSAIANGQTEENALLSPGHYNVKDTDIRRTIVKQSDLTAFRAFQKKMDARNETLLPENLRNRFRELALHSGAYDRMTLTGILGDDAKCTFGNYGKLLETCTSKMGTLPQTVDFDGVSGKDIEKASAAGAVGQLTMNVEDAEDGDFFRKIAEYAPEDVRPKLNPDECSVKDLVSSLDVLFGKLAPRQVDYDIDDLETFGSNQYVLGEYVLTSDATTESLEYGFDGVRDAVSKRFSDEFAVRDGGLFGPSSFALKATQKEYSSRVIHESLRITVDIHPALGAKFDALLEIVKEKAESGASTDEDIAAREKCRKFLQELASRQKDLALSEEAAKIVGGDINTEKDPLRAGPDGADPLRLLKRATLFKTGRTLFDYQRLDALVASFGGKLDVAHTKLTAAARKTYDALLEKLSALPGDRTFEPKTEKLSFGDLGELIRKVKVGFALKYQPLDAETELPVFKKFYRQVNGREYAGDVVTVHRCKTELRVQAEKTKEKALGRFEQLDYGNQVIGRDLVSKFVQLCEGAQKLGLPGYENLDKVEGYAAAANFKPDDPNGIITVTNGQYIELANAVERELKKQPRLSDNQAVVSNVFENNKDFVFGDGEDGKPYVMFSDGDPFYRQPASVSQEDIADADLYDRTGPSVLFFEKGLKEGIPVDRAEKYGIEKRDLIMRNALRIRRHSYRQLQSDDFNKPVVAGSKAQTMKDKWAKVYEGLDEREKTRLDHLGGVAVTRLLETRSGAGSDTDYALSGRYFDLIRGILSGSGKWGNCTAAFKAFSKARDELRNAEIQNSGDPNWITGREHYRLREALSDARRALGSRVDDLLGEKGLSRLLDYQNHPEQLEKDRKKPEFEEPDMTFLPILQELIVRLRLVDPEPAQ